MKRREPRRVRYLTCEGCGGKTASYDSVHSGSAEDGYRRLCSRCFNTLAAREAGYEHFEDVRFEPVRLADAAGREREFHFRTFFFGHGVSVSAFEIYDGDPGGYMFDVIGEPDDDLMVLFGRLIERVRRGLAVRHLKEGPYGTQIADFAVRGRIEWDEAEDGRVPLLVIDGRGITWEEFGRMLMTFEGWQFRLNILDKSEEP